MAASPEQIEELELAFREYIEGAILEHSELVEAVQAVQGRTSGPIISRQCLTDWASVKQILALLAFAPDANDHWQFLGIPREEGPFPSLDMIERRARLGHNFASVRHTSAWSEADKKAAQATCAGNRIEAQPPLQLVGIPPSQSSVPSLQHSAVINELILWNWTKSSQTRAPLDVGGGKIGGEGSTGVCRAGGKVCGGCFGVDGGRIQTGNPACPSPERKVPSPVHTSKMACGL